MSDSKNLGEFEQLVLLAILRLQKEGAYGVSIRREISEHTNRTPTPGAIYTTLDRLEKKKFVISSVGEATPIRGGRSKRLYKVSTSGLSALNRVWSDISTLSSGISFPIKC